ncbi:laminin subunit alpha-1 [Hemiscyllium ocellatum]|uniref:laminin subunit alpha-1 n=1 Tax=Hemiscyllium ocellatum TaxID=170820 RepID=UPI00296711E8|nr:laminin subunit alpha-1 [Hemiscyllium ocellatum]
MQPRRVVELQGMWPLTVLLLLLCVPAESQQRGLFPAILNLASNAVISTNATCGENGPEMYCKLVEHVPGRPIRNPQCRICDSNSANRKERHPIVSAIDGTNNWWQSPSIQNGRKYHWVTITLDLRQVFQVAYVIIKAANSPRPGNWVLERSIDGVEFTPWQYYATSDTECLTRYNIAPRIGPPTYKRDDEVICTSYYSRLVPLEHGEIHTSLINGRPSADDPSPTLLAFTSARYIRLLLQRIRTLNADLMTLGFRDPREVDPIVTRRYYYSIKDISVGGMCICYGHARSCPWDEALMRLQCQCEHNTCGESCSECCPGYHQKPWQSGTFASDNTCEKCNCHDKAEDCYYDQSVADRKLSLNIHGQYNGGGVCINCTNNTAGINCETCIDGFYRPHKVSPFDHDPCLPCDCNPAGSINATCVKDDNHALIERGLFPGQCHCQDGYTGKTCSHCAPGFKGFPSCARCNCSVAGSINDDPCAEPCQCKRNVEGENCNQCKPGFYNLQERNPEGCTECFCFGLSGVCESISWSITQVTDVNGWQVTDRQGIKKIQSYQDLYGDPTRMNVNITEATKSLPALYYWTAPELYLGNKLTAYGGYLKFTVLYDFPMESSVNEAISNIDVIIEGNGRTLSTGSEGLLLQPYDEKLVSVRLLPENFVDLNTNNAIDRDRLMTVLVNVTRLQIRVMYNVAKQAVYRLNSVTLDVANPNAIDILPAVDVEHCECPPDYSGISCESCSPGFYRVDGILFGGICQQCECNGHATECDTNGTCLGCQHNTTGRNCNQCSLGLYGDASRGTSEDCQPCACPLNISSNNFSPTCYLNKTGSIICDQCQPGYTGTRCNRCADGYYGNPTTPGGSCVPCDCNGNVEVSVTGNCDTVTGECLKCIGNTAGIRCEQCAEGFFGDAVVNKNCRTCDCNVNGSYGEACDPKTGHCQCKPNVLGQKCDHCLHGYFGLSTGLGCVPCNCSQLGSLSEDCSDDGLCRCVPGVSGEKCDRCAHGFYGFQDGGCTPCDCTHTQNNCAEDSGQCICPAHTYGDKCEHCEANYWGHDPESGCKFCNCSVVGSVGLQCDRVSGQCPCKEEFGGEKCSKCTVGHRGYPQCTACKCNLNGTRPEKCDLTKGVCSCGEHTGLCPCKDSVSGVHCDECRSGSFALSLQHPEGCSSCYCSGVSNSCSELEGLVRIPLTLTPDQLRMRVVTQGNLTGTREGVFAQPPETLLDAALVQRHLQTEPYYWSLPAQFTGTKLLAYGGKLSYVVAFYALEGSGSLNLEPQILLKGRHSGKMVIYRNMPTPANGEQIRHMIDLTEHEWKYFNSASDQPVTRLDFMSVLSNVEYFLIKASYGTGLQQSRISNISMEIAMEDDGTHALRDRARQIEICDCPPGYTGLSCQECAPGFYRQKMIDGLQSLNTVCVSCKCNNHSNVCDLDTGKCQACRDNTMGDHCELCAAGYYGRVGGSITDCSLCACPRSHSGSFSPTCVLEGVSDFRCNSCLIGYEGQYCERCAPGYYGSPRVPGGRCQRCECNPNGSVHINCHPLMGHCVCKSGVTGRLCNQCEAKHVLVESECISCDDDCTGLLLSDLSNLETILMTLNVTGFDPAPYNLFTDIENRTEQYKMTLSTERNTSALIAKVEEQMAGLTLGISHLQQKVALELADGRNLDETVGRTLTRGLEVAAFVNKTTKTISALVDMANHLNETLGTDLNLSDTKLQQLQHEILNMLESMRNRVFNHSKEISEMELKAAQDLLASVQKEFQKPHMELKDLKIRVKDMLVQRANGLQEAQSLVNEARSNTNESSRLLLSITSGLRELQGKQQTVRNIKTLTTSLIQDGREMLDTAANMTEDIVNNTAFLEQYSDQLDLWNTKMRMHLDKLVMEMTQKSVLSLVYKAEDHAEGLSEIANLLNSSLAAVRNMSLNATVAINTHSNIKALIDEAASIALEARNKADAALKLATGPQKALEEFGRKSAQRSSEILNDANDLKNRTAGFVNQLNGLKGKVDQIQKGVGNVSRHLSKPWRILAQLPNGTDARFQEAKDRAVSANLTAAATLAEIQQFSQQLLSTSGFVARVNKTIRETNDLISDSVKTAAAAGKKVQEVEVQANYLLDKLKPLKVLEENLNRNLSEIKELISQARKQAASIKVAVSANRDCVRAYQPTVTSSNYNTLTLNVKTSESENLLFYLGSSTNTEFLAVEMKHGRVVFLWDVGSGTTRLEYPNLQINNNKWYRIHAARFGRMGTLSVQEVGASSLDKPVVKTASSPGTSTVLDVGNTTLVFVGGLSKQMKKVAAVKITHFKGCLGEAFLDGKSIGLWNFREREGSCSGCFARSQNEDIAFHFDGSGYSAVEKVLRSTTTQLVMQFSTFSPNGLLLYLASNGTRDFLAVELADGKVRVTFDLGSGVLTLMSEKRYNNGTWFKIAFQRNRKQGILAVMDPFNSTDRETKQGESPGTASDLNRGHKDPIYVGGLPRSRSYRKEVLSKSFVGCLKKLEIYRSTFDLLRNSLGVRKGCLLEPIRSVTVWNDGFIQLQPQVLPVEARLMSTFSTQNDTGIILAGFGKSTRNRNRRQTKMAFFAVMMIDGRVEAHVNTGDGVHTRRVIAKSPSGTFSDGQEHSIILSRSKRIMTLQIDEGNRLEMRLGASADTSPLNITRFYVGGVPTGEGAIVLKITSSFTGCIKNLVLNTELLDFSGVLRYQNIDLDSCRLSAPEPDKRDLELVLQPTVKPIQPTVRNTSPTHSPYSSSSNKKTCAVDKLPGHVANAHQFGLSKGSHMILSLDETTVKRKFVVQLNIRTYASNGLIYYMAHQNQIDYATLQLWKGQLHFLFNLGKGTATSIMPTPINDGKWHTVKTEYVKRRGLITVDGKESNPALGDGNSLDVEGKLYLGGLPLDYTARKIGNATHSIPACIGNVALNNKPLDLERPVSILTVSRCYLAVQEGTFFDGTGFAALVKEGYKVRSDVIVTFEFRSTTRNAVLLGISSAKVDAIGLEIVNGKVLFHVNNGAGRITARYEPKDSNQLCNGKWHKLRANKSKHRITLTMDGVTVQADNPHIQSTSADTNDPIYVGGYPANVKQNCLTLQEPFQGCIRNLKLTKNQQIQAFDFSKAFDLRGVFPHSCPGIEH